MINVIMKYIKIIILLKNVYLEKIVQNKLDNFKVSM